MYEWERSHAEALEELKEWQTDLFKEVMPNLPLTSQLIVTQTLQNEHLSKPLATYRDNLTHLLPLTSDKPMTELLTEAEPFFSDEVRQCLFENKVYSLSPDQCHDIVKALTKQESIVNSSILDEGLFNEMVATRFDSSVAQIWHDFDGDNAQRKEEAEKLLMAMMRANEGGI